MAISVAVSTLCQSHGIMLKVQCDCYSDCWQEHVNIQLITVNGERFAGLNFRGFHSMKFSRENFRCTLRLKHSNNAIIRSLHIFTEKLSRYSSKPRKPRKFSPANLSPFTVYTFGYIVTDHEYE